MRLTCNELSAMNRGDFVRTLGGVFEHSPWVAEGAWGVRPFATLDELHVAMWDIVMNAGITFQLGLIRAHPQLAGSEAKHESLTPESLAEQSSAGLQHCTHEEVLRLQEGNRAYLEKFGFPFVMAVKHCARAEILSALELRLRGAPGEEFLKCLAEIRKIARFRLESIVGRS